VILKLRHGQRLRLSEETIEVSLKMAELSLLPAVRKANAETILVADGIVPPSDQGRNGPRRAPRRSGPRQKHGSGEQTARRAVNFL
jgi:hypothetical protein